MSRDSNRLVDAAESLISSIRSDGYVYQPWQIAAYITALRTRPFVILAGVSGTGKSRLPVLVAKYTGMRSPLRVSVRPDWNDSAEVLGYVDLQNRFRPGLILRQMQIAEADSAGFHTCIIDEMNLARVEYYFAEILSAAEDCVPDPAGGFRSTPVLVQQLPDEDAQWQQQVLPLVATSYWRSIDENGRPTDHFWRFDLLLFQSVFALDILLRVLRLRRRFPALSWRDALLRRWIDLPLLLPFWRWLRLVPVVDFKGRTKTLFGDVMEELDWSIGEVLKTVKDQGLDKNTLVLFIMLFNAARVKNQMDKILQV